MEQCIKKAVGLMVLMASSCQASHYGKEYDYNKNYLPEKERVIVLTNDSPALDQILKNNTQQGVWAINRRKEQVGLASIAIQDTPDTVGAMLMNADGSFVIAGGIATGAGKSMVARFLPNGTYDISFAGVGYAVFDASFAGGANSLSSIISDGTTSNGYYVGGSLPANGGIGHVTYAGGLVTTFGGAGTGIFTAPAPFTTVSGLAMQSSGKIVYTGLANANNFAVNRITSAGVTDTTFTAYTAATMGATGIAVDSQDRVVVVGSHTGTHTGSVYRFNVNGGLDTTFNGGTGSWTLADFDIYAVTVLSDNSIIVVGNNNGTHAKIVKLTPTGVLDTTFGNGGVTLVRVADNAISIAQAVTILPDDKIAVAAIGDKGADFTMQAILMHPNGILDTGFVIFGLIGNLAGPGTVEFAINGASKAYAVGYQNNADSGLVVAGTANNNDSIGFALLTDAAVKDNA